MALHPRPACTRGRIRNLPHSCEYEPTVLTQSAPRTAHFDSLSPHGFHRVCYYEWGDPAMRRS